MAIILYSLKEIKTEKKVVEETPKIAVETELKVTEPPKQLPNEPVNLKEPEPEIRQKPNDIKPESQPDIQRRHSAVPPQETFTMSEPDQLLDETKTKSFALIENDSHILRNKTPTDPSQIMSQMKISNTELLNNAQQHLKLKQEAQYQLDESLAVNNQKINKLPLNEVCQMIHL